MFTSTNIRGSYELSNVDYLHPCDNCGRLLTKGMPEVYHTVIWALSRRSKNSSNRVGIQHGYAFCSPECRTEHWCAPSKERFAVVHNPNTIEEIQCPNHRDGDACGLCNGTEVMRVTPDFYYSDETMIGWDEKWATYAFDTNIDVTVFECKTSDKAWICVSDQFRTNCPECIVEAHLFSNPIELNTWWRCSVDLSEHLALRSSLKRHYKEALKRYEQRAAI